MMFGDISAKRLQMLKEAVPRTHTGCGPLEWTRYSRAPSLVIYL